MADILIYGDTVRDAVLRHEVPLAVPDAFLYAERDGRRYAVVPALEAPRVRELPGIEVLTYEDVGYDELIAQGVEREELYLGLAANACRRLGIERATVPPAFPLELADHLRSQGIELAADRRPFAARRRVKTEVELAGIRRAQRAAEAAMDAVREALRDARTDGEALALGGELLTCELVKRRVRDVLNERDMVADDLIVSHGAQTAIGHEAGFGPIRAGEPIVVDLWPKDRETGCYSDMTRTFVVGDPPDELVEYHRRCREALELALGLIKPGAEARSVYLAVCELFEQHGYPTGRTKRAGEVLEEGFYHGLGHGVGLEVHEEPGLGRADSGSLLAGDVVTVEPGLYRPGLGGCRLEDIVLVTEAGAENLTEYPYDLTP